MDPVEDLELASFSDEESTDDMELDQGNDDNFQGVQAHMGGIDLTRPVSPIVEPQYSPQDTEETIGPGIHPEMPWHDGTKVVERWLQMYQVH